MYPSESRITGVRYVIAIRAASKAAWKQSADEHGQLRAYAGGHDAQREGGVAGDVPVVARRHLGRLDLVPDREVLGRVAEVEARLERGDVGRGDFGARRELAVQEPQRRLVRP